MRSFLRPRLVALVFALLAPAVLWSALPMGAQGAGEQELRDQIAGSRDREQQLGSAAQRLARLERAASRGVARIAARQAEVQAQLDAAEGRLAATEAELASQRARALRLRRKLGRDRAQLASMLRASYMTSAPDLVSVVTQANGFNDLLTRVEFAQTVQRASASVIGAVRSGRRDAVRQKRTFARLQRRQVATAADVQRERNAIAQMAAAAQARRTALAQARAARLAALAATRGNRKRAQRTLQRLLDAQAKAAVDKRGPGGPWAIPWAIVQCESGGQNLPPNAGAQASGYYQFIPSTWKGLGGSTPHAYLASKAEQDRLAARLWADGAGARNWDCAAIVGLL